MTTRAGQPSGNRTVVRPSPSSNDSGPARVLDDAFMDELLEPKRQCKARKIIDSLDGEDRDRLDSIIHSDVSCASISKALKRRDISLSERQIRSHRKEECACGVDS